MGPLISSMRDAWLHPFGLQNPSLWSDVINLQPTCIMYNVSYALQILGTLSVQVSAKDVNQDILNPKWRT